MAGGVEYQVTKVDPTNPETKGMVYQVHKVTEEVAATLGGKVYRARIIKDPSDPTVAGKVYQIVLIGDPDDPAVKGKVYNAILTGDSEVVVIGPAVSPLALDDAIADSLTYVKAFGGTEQRNLPDGYTALEYIESSGTQYIDLDVSGDATFIGTAQSTTDSPTTSQVLVANSGASAGHWFGVQSPGAGSSFAKRWGLGATATASSTIDGTTKVDFEITFTQSSQYGTVNDQVLNRESSTSAHTNWVVFAGNTTPLYGFIGKVWGLKVVQNDVLVRNLIPAKNSSNVVGMYDIVSGQFFTNAGTGTFTAGADVVPTPDTPVDIVSNNGVLKYSKNLLDMAPENIVLGKYINNSGVILDSGPNFYNSKYIPVVAGETYTWSTSDSIKYLSIMEYDSSKTFIKRTLFGSSQTEAGTSGTLTLDSTTAYVLLGSNMFTGSQDITLEKIQAVDWQFELGSVATTYRPYGQIYTDGEVETIGDSANHTATVATLLGVGDYRDTQNINTGAITRNVGVKVLDGTESWTEQGDSGANNHRFSLSLDTPSTTNVTALCTHIKNIIQSSTTMQTDRPCIRFNTTGSVIFWYEQNNTTTLAQFQQYLAEQYAAGTPVIIVYPLKTATTESVAGQTLQVTDGDNVLEITQASIDGLELEAEYEKEGA